jgi:hypothetical protein
MYVSEIPDSSGLAINSTTTASGYSDEERTIWNRAKEAFIDQTVALTRHGPVQAETMMKPGSLSASQFTFTGKLKTATFQTTVRQTTSRTGLNSFSLVTAYWLKGSWRATESDASLRTSSNSTAPAVRV